MKVSLCIEGVDLNSSPLSSMIFSSRLPLHRGSGFKHNVRRTLKRRILVSLCIEGVDLNCTMHLMFFQTLQSPSA